MTKLLISVDPGIRATGVGVFMDKTLISSQYLYNPMSKGLGPDASSAMAWAVHEWLIYTFPNLVGSLVMEWPQVYTVSKGDPNDLLPLAGVDAALVALLRVPSTHYLPFDWKGQLPKEVMCQRAFERLTDDEKTKVHNVGALTHNVLDAIGVGLHHLGRLKPKRVFAR